MRDYPADRFVIGLLVAAGIIAAVACAARAEDGHALHHDKYMHWKQPGTNISCCNERKVENGVVTGDCSPAEARVVNGSWIARKPDGEWIDIPDDRIIRERNPSSEDGHLCYNYGKVLCFVPPFGGG